jgi:hypothetical protein
VRVSAVGYSNPNGDTDQPLIFTTSCGCTDQIPLAGHAERSGSTGKRG